MEQIEIDIEELAKAKKRVWVKATATRKGHYREQEVGYEERVLSGDKQRKEWHSEIKSLVVERDAIKSDLSAAQDLSESHLKEMDRQINNGEDISTTRIKYEASQKVWHKHNDRMNGVNDKIYRVQDKIDKSYD